MPLTAMYSTRTRGGGLFCQDVLNCLDCFAEPFVPIAGNPRVRAIPHLKFADALIEKRLSIIGQIPHYIVDPGTSTSVTR